MLMFDNNDTLFTVFSHKIIYMPVSHKMSFLQEIIFSYRISSENWCLYLRNLLHIKTGIVTFSWKSVKGISWQAKKEERNLRRVKISIYSPWLTFPSSFFFWRIGMHAHATTLLSETTYLAARTEPRTCSSHKYFWKARQKLSQETEVLIIYTFVQWLFWRKTEGE